MAIAIKNLDENDHKEFKFFLQKDRKDLPELNLSSLAKPHEDIAVVSCKSGMTDLSNFSHHDKFTISDCGNNVSIVSRFSPSILDEHTNFIMSGYVFHNEKMLIGMDEVLGEVKYISDIKEALGEFCTCTITKGKIKLESDFFGMVPWFYYDDDNYFVASNNYHLMLTLLHDMRVSLSMNIKRSRVNMITSGFTYGSPFSSDLDVNNCKINHSYESINFDVNAGVEVKKTELWEILSHSYDWDEDLYEELIEGAKNEIYSNCKASFEHKNFTEIVVDVSGGFDSRIVFATACCLPKKLRKKMSTHTRPSNSSDDFSKAIALTNIYNYPQKHYDSHPDPTPLIGTTGKINLDHVSRTLGVFTISPHVYSATYNNSSSLQLTGYLGEVILGYKRVRGELNYSLGDRRLLSRLGGCFLHNSVDELKTIFADQEEIILQTLAQYPTSGLFKKFHHLYTDFRNRFICGSSHLIENNNFRIPMLFSKNALKAKWLYFSKFSGNTIPDEKVSIDLLNSINPLFSIFPFEDSNNDVIPIAQNILNPAKVIVVPDLNNNQKHIKPKPVNAYRRSAMSYTDDLEVAEQMLLQIFDYSEEYYSVCLGMFKVLSLCREDPSNHPTGRTREAIRKIYDTFYQIKLVL